MEDLKKNDSLKLTGVSLALPEIERLACQSYSKQLCSKHYRTVVRDGRALVVCDILILLPIPLNDIPLDGGLQ